jgi:hypothetical protein
LTRAGCHAFGDEGHRKGWCLYKLGCKGPVTHAACATRHFNEIPGLLADRRGIPCVGCTEKERGLEDGDVRDRADSSGDSARYLSRRFTAARRNQNGRGGFGRRGGWRPRRRYLGYSQRFQSSQEAGGTNRSRSEKLKAHPPQEKPVDKKED